MKINDELQSQTKDPLGKWPTPSRPTILGQRYLFDY